MPLKIKGQGQAKLTSNSRLKETKKTQQSNATCYSESDPGPGKNSFASFTINGISKTFGKI